MARDVPYSAMTDASYLIVRRDDDSFAVEIERPGALAQMAAGFATEAAANAWILQDKRLWNAADPFRAPSGRNWRGT
jgi:hypothetical protein